MTFSFFVRVSNIAKSFTTKSKLSLPKQYHSMRQIYLPKTYNFYKLCNNKICTIRIREFQTSPPKYALPPLIVFAVRTLAKFGAIISGRLIRKWWQKLSPEEKERVLAQIRSRKSKLAGFGTFFIGLLYLYYIENFVEDPITKRKKFIILNQHQINQIAEFEYQQQLKTFRRFIVPSVHPLHRRVAKVVNNLLLSNKDLDEIRNKIWTVTVVDRPDVVNAFALPHGKIFVFTGMMNVCTNEDQLAMVVAHEISHAILSHVAESMSNIVFLEFLLLIPSLIFWTILSDAWALFSEWITSTLAKILIQLPFSRALEKEADLVGLRLAAKSCYDVREAPLFWKKMKILSQDAPVEWLSTHPRHETRQLELQDLVPEAIRIRENSKCPPLSARFW